MKSFILVLSLFCSLAVGLQWPSTATRSYPWIGPSQIPSVNQTKFICVRPDGSESVSVQSPVSALDGNATFAFFGSKLYALDANFAKKWTWSAGFSDVVRSSTPVLANSNTVTVTTWDISNDKVHTFKAVNAQNGLTIPQPSLPQLVTSNAQNGISLATDGQRYALSTSDGTVALYLPRSNWTVPRMGSGENGASYPISFLDSYGPMFYVWKNTVFMVSADGSQFSPFYTADEGLNIRGAAVPASQMLIVPVKEDGIFGSAYAVAVTSTGAVTWKKSVSGTMLAYRPASQCVVVVSSKSASCLSLADGSTLWKTDFSVPQECGARNVILDSAGTLFVQFSADWRKSCPIAYVALSYNQGSILYTQKTPDQFNARDITMNAKGVVLSIYYFLDDSKQSCLMAVGDYH